MKKFIAALCLSLFIFGIAHAEEIYDPQHTVLALNMAVVSINRILKTEDRAVLEWEYDNIISNLAFGNIESDPEIIELYRELMNFINGKKLRQEDSQKLRESFERRQKEAYYRSMYEGFMSLSVIPTDSMQATTRVSKDESSTTVGAEGGAEKEGRIEKKGIMSRLSGWLKISVSHQEAHTLMTQDPFLPLLGWCGNLSLSAVSSLGMSYYGYHAQKERIRSEIDSELWRLKREEIESCHQLQSKLLNSSWRLLRQYRLPDEYRLTESTLAKFFMAMETSDTSDRLKMLKIIERDFMAYPPYWFYRARTAFDTGDMNECDNCLSKFNEVWRPVLRKDCYKAEAAKYQVSRIIQTSEPTKESLDRIRALADTIHDYSPDDDWSNRIFAGLLYFGIGEKEKAVTCVEENILFGYEKDMSGAVLEEMKKRSESFTFSDITKTLRMNALEYRKGKFLASIKDSELSAVLTKYFDSCDIEAFAGFECLMKGEIQESKQHFSKIDEYCDGLFIIGIMYAKGLEVEKDYREAATYYEVAARLGHLQSQWELGNLYYDGGPNLERDYMTAYKWYQVIHPTDIETETGKFVEYAAEVIMSPFTLFYNIVSGGGALLWVGSENIKSAADDRIMEIEGWGWFNFEKGSSKERNQARREAQAIRDAISERQKNWKH